MEFNPESFFVFGDDRCAVFTKEKQLCEHLQALCKLRPTECKRIGQTSDGANFYRFPKDWLTIMPPESFQ